MLGHCVCLSLLLLLLGSSRALGGVVYYNIPNDGTVLPSTYFEIDEENSKLIVGATNVVFNLDFGLTTPSNVVQYPVQPHKLDACNGEGLDPMKCSNIHHLVKKTSGPGVIVGADNTTYKFDDLILMCSSHAYHPECVYRTAKDLKLVKQFLAYGYIPSEVNPPMPALLLDGNALITAPDLNSFDRIHKVLVAKSTSPFDSDASRVGASIGTNWFIEPNFVAMNEIGEFIYIFFREKAKERSSNVYYSRVARVCKNDLGALHVENRKIYTTFEKARITCDSGSSETYFYDEIQDTYYDQEQGLLYALFNAARNGPVGSAMCVYSINTTKNDISKVFETGKFYNQSGSGLPSPTSVGANFGCTRSLRDALDYQLLVNRSQPITTTPLIKQNGVSFHRMAPPISVNGHDVVFVTATKDAESHQHLYLLKYSKLHSAVSYDLIENVTLPGELNKAHVTKMVVQGTGKNAFVLVGTTNVIYRVPVQNCQELTCQECVNSPDPFCYYNESGGVCSAVDGSEDASVDLPIRERSSVCAPVETTTVLVETTTQEKPDETDSPKSDPTFNVVGLETFQQDFLGHNVWIIVGCVCGFVFGLLVGVIVAVCFRRVICRRNNKLGCTSVSSSCELANGSRNNSITVAPLKLHSVIINPTDSKTQQDFMNNSSDFSNPPDKTDADSCKKIPPSPPLKTYPSVSPTKSSESDDSGITGTSKCSDLPTPSPKVYTMPSPTKSNPPQSSGYRQQGAIFKFDPTSIKKNISSGSGEARGKLTGGSCAEPALDDKPSMGARRGTDPNLKSNYRQNVHLTNQQRQSYGRNILSRYPSIDGSKSKYIPSSDSSGGRRPPPVRPKPSKAEAKPSSETQTVLQLDDGDVGSSQC